MNDQINTCRIVFGLELHANATRDIEAIDISVAGNS